MLKYICFKYLYLIKYFSVVVYSVKACFLLSILVSSSYQLSPIPGSRYLSISWVDAENTLWLFGGAGYDTDTFGNHYSIPKKLFTLT